MTSGLLPEAQARALYALVEQHAAAPADLREQFVALAGTDGITEFRIGGTLGPGAKIKFSRHRPGFYVDCYREHLTAERQQIIDTLNALIDTKVNL